MLQTSSLRPHALVAAIGFALVVLAFDSPGARVLGLVALVGTTIWGYLDHRKSDDEVVQAANLAAVSWGAPIGLGAAFSSIFVLRYVGAANELVTSMASQSSPAISPATAAFGMGVLFSCALVCGCSGIAWFAWWASKR